jgi:acetyl-CoA C-acetyltransferase
VNRLCGSGLEAVIQAWRLIRLGEAEVVLAGGTESLSQAPHWARVRRGQKLGDLALSDALTAALTDPRLGLAMGETAEVLAAECGIDREQQDAFAAESQRRAAVALAEGRFVAQTVPVETERGRVEADEGVRGDTTVAALARLRPAFRPDGTVTAGNASRLADGAGAVVLAGERAAQRLDLPVLGVVRGHAAVGVDPLRMGLGPVEALPRALAMAGVPLAELDVVELNEAFAAQALAVMRRLELDPARTNPNGGAIALGHPLGATGAILLVKLLAELARAGGRYGACTLCIGGGQGIALVVERGDV